MAFSEGFRFFFAILVGCLSRIHARVFWPVGEWWADTLLGTWEESIKSIVRETFATIVRVVNGVSAFVIARLDSSYHYSTQGGWAQQSAWQNWWNDRQTTLNAVVERLEGTRPVGPNPSQTNNAGESGPAQAATTSKVASQVTAQSSHTDHRPPRAPKAARGDQRPRKPPPGGPLPPTLKMNLGELFERPAGYAISEGIKRTGLIEDLRVTIEIWVTAVFVRLKWIVRTAFGVPTQTLRRSLRSLSRQSAQPAAAAAAAGGPAAENSPLAAHGEINFEQPRALRSLSGSGPHKDARRKVHRSRSLGGFEQIASATSQDLASAGHIIKMAGYPLEVHRVVTADGYVLTMERIPRVGAADSVFFMHGVLDTSLGWVSAGITGSQAFAAWDQGLDVWLGNTRCNPPRLHQVHSGMRYWRFTHNELATQDIAAQVDYIHNTKCAEMGAGDVHINLDKLGPLAPQILGRAQGSVKPATPLGAPHVGRLRASASDTNLQRPRHAPFPLEVPIQPLSPPTNPTDQHAHVTDISETHASSARHPSGGPTAPPPSPATTVGSLPRQRGVRVSFYGNDTQQLRSSFELHAKSSDVTEAASRLLGTESSEDSEESGGPFDLEMQDLENAHRGVATGAAGGLLTKILTRGRWPSTPPAPAPTAESGAVDQTGQVSTLNPGASYTCEEPEEATPGPSHRQPLGSSPANTRWSFSSPFRMLNRKHASGTPATTDEITSPPADPNTKEAEGPPAPDTPDIQQTPASSQLLLSPDGSLPEPPSSRAAALAAHPLQVAQSNSSGVVLDTQHSMQGVSATAQPSPTQSPASPGITASLSERLLSLVRRQQPAEPAVSGDLVVASTLASSSSCSEGPTWQAEGQPVSAFATPHVQQVEQQIERTASWGSAGRRSSPSLPRSPPDGCSATPSQPAPAGSLSQALAQQASSSMHSTAPAPSRRSGSFPLPQRHAIAASAPGPAISEPQVVRRCFTAVQPLDDLSLPQASTAGLAQGGTLQDRLHLQAWARLPLGQSQVIPKMAMRRSVSSGTLQAGLAVPAVVSAPPTGEGAQAQAVPGCGPDGEPYRLRCVSHSLGGACVLMYCIMRARQGKPHHLSRLILLTPAGFHVRFPKVAWMLIFTVPLLMRVMKLFIRGFAGALYIPTLLMRSLTFKLTLDVRRIPALAELMRIGMRSLLNGDISQWDRAMQMPHYNATAMPALSLHQTLHFAQWATKAAFNMFDYGSRRANRRHYGQDTPIDVAAEYWRLKVPVDLVAGAKDGVIPPENIRMHAAALKEAGVALTYREFDYGHLDFTFAAKEELRLYVLSKLMRK